MRSVLAMAVKDLLLVTRDRLGLFFIVGFPVLMGVFFGSMYNWVGSSGSVRMTVAVVDEDQSDMSARFLEALGESDGVSLEPLPRDEAIDGVRRGQIAGMIVVPKGFGETAGLMWEQQPAIGLGIDPSRKAEAGMLEGLVMKASGEMMMDRFQDPASMRPLIQNTRDLLAADDNPEDQLDAAMRPYLLNMMDSLDALMGSVEEVQAAEANSGGGNSNLTDEFQLARVESIDVTYQPAEGSIDDLARKMRSKWDISFPQGMLWGVLACAASFAISIVRERKQGTLLRLTAAPVGRWQVLLGKAGACFLTVLFVILLLTVLGVMLGMRPQSPALLVVASLSVAFCFVGIMVLMSVIGKSEEAVSGAAWGANMLMAMFGGGMIPLAFMPDFMVTLSQASPVKWSILALEGAIWRGFAPSEMLLPCGLLLAIGAGTMILGAVRFARSGS